MKIIISRLRQDLPPIISRVWCVYKSDKCVILQVDLHKKWQNPEGYADKEIWFGNEGIFVYDLGFDCLIHAETSKYTTFITLQKQPTDSSLLDSELMWDDDVDEYSEVC